MGVRGRGNTASSIFPRWEGEGYGEKHFFRGWGDAGEGSGQRSVEGVGDDDYSQTLKIKAAQALFRMSLEPGGEVRAKRVIGDPAWCIF